MRSALESLGLFGNVWEVIVLVMDFLQRGYRIAQKLLGNWDQKTQGPFWLSYNASTHHSTGEGATQDLRGVGKSTEQSGK